MFEEEELDPFVKNEGESPVWSDDMWANAHWHFMKKMALDEAIRLSFAIDEG